MFNEGLVIGKFATPTNGHLTMIGMALMKCHKLNVVVCIDHLHDPKDCPMSPIERFAAMKEECARISDRIEVHTIDCTAFPYAKEDNEEVSKYWAKVLHEKFPNVKTLFGSELYVEMMAKAWPDCLGVNCEVLDLKRSMTNISATEIRKDPFGKWEHIPSTVKPYYTKNVLVLGAESCGKTTMTRELANILKAPMVPEMYRSIYCGKGMDFTPDDLVDVAKAQYKAQHEASRHVFNKGVVLHDTCVEITAMYLTEYFADHERYGDVLADLQSYIKREPKFDVVLFCDMDVNWVNDGTRTLGNEADRKRMRDKAYSLAVQKAQRHGCSLVVMPADYQRLPVALEEVRKVM